MPKGYSLHIGINKFDRNVYGGGLSFLQAAVNDAIFWQRFAKEQGYTSSALLTDQEATQQAVLGFLQEKSQELNPGDLLLVTYSGHGDQVRNEKIGVKDSERHDQTWCLYDGQLLDDELYQCFQQFAEGVRITIISDSCHSGTVTRDTPPYGIIDLKAKLQEGIKMGLEAWGCIDRGVSKDERREISRQGEGEKIKAKQKQFTQSRKGKKVKAAVTLLAACQDDETTFDGDEFGLFTEKLKTLLSSTHGKASAAELIAQVKTLYAFPRPNLFTYGAIIPTYHTHSPFAIEIPECDLITGYEEGLTPGADLLSRGLSSKTPNVQLRLIVPPGFTPLEDAEFCITSEKTIDGQKVFDIELLDTSVAGAWDAAHALQAALKAENIEVQVEPIYVDAQEALSREGRSDSADYLPEWPPALQEPKVNLGWHLGPEHSQLAAAVAAVRQKCADNPPKIRIAHIDTGYIENHPGLPKYLNTQEARSFIPKENPHTAIDRPNSGQDRHGTGTLILLAGDKVTSTALFDEHDGEMGGIPFAEVIPMRIAEQVVLTMGNSKRFAAAVEAAIELGCEVITMSMAGMPSPEMSEAVDKAYQAGIVVVSAASNCWYQGPLVVLPKCVLYPAAFPQVIAAVGAMHNHSPYDQRFLRGKRSKINTQYMQGCWGPASRMKYALAAYTPNVPWVGTNQDFTRGGGGTSSATPQVAAAAALWIAYHRKELEAAGYYQAGQAWKKVEAVRRALFKSAAKATVFNEWQKYYGNGIVRALDALQIGIPADEELIPAPQAKVLPSGLVETFVSFFKNRKSTRAIAVQPSDKQLALELMQVLQSDADLFDLLERIDAGEKLEQVLDEAGRKRVRGSGLVSNFLKGRLG